MFTIRILILCIFVTLFLASCDHKDPTFQVRNYPSADGAEWHYDRTFLEIAHDSAGTDTVITSIAKMNVRLERSGTFYSWNNVFELHISGYEVDSDTAFFDSVSVWYELTDTTLNEIANFAAGGTPIVFPKSSGRLIYSPLIGLHPFIAKGDTEFRTRKVLEYPLYSNRSWIAFDDVWIQTATVESEEDITVPGGTFTAFKVRYENQGVPEHLEFYSYFANQGLVKRDLTFTGELVNITGDSVGYVEMIEKTELAGYMPGN